MKAKLQVNRRLPYIKLPKEKVGLFAKWYNIDLRDLEELPEVFEEGYLEIDTSEYVSMKLPTIFDIKSAEKFEQLKELHNKTSITYSKMIIHFNISSNSILKLTGYYGNSEPAFDIEFNLKEDETVKKMKQYVASSVGRDYKHLPEIQDKLQLDLWKYSTLEDMQSEQKAFNRSLGESCFGLVVSVIWYLATNTSEKYLVSNTKVVESHQNINTNKHHKHHNRTITAPIYYLVDKKPITVDKLIKKRNGWTISHSFQVRGHYRHYKNGKVIFIKSYEKGKELDNFQNSVITVSPDY